MCGQDEQPFKKLILCESLPLLLQQTLYDAAVQHVQMLWLGAVQYDKQC